MTAIGLRLALLAPLVFVLGAGYASRIPAVDDHASVEPDDDVLIDVLANDGVLGSGLTLLRVGGARLGTAVVEDQQVRYSAAAGASGTDQLTYTVRRANGQVAGGRIFVTVGAPPMQLSLRGHIADVGDTCDLAVVVGDERFEGCTSSGSFQIEVDSRDVDAVVVIEATARPSDIGEDYRFASVLGSLPRLLEMAEDAGTPGVLDDSQFGHLRLQDYTTMHHAQLVAEGGPGVFASEDALAQVQKDLDAQRLHALAVTFRAARRGWVALPTGVDDPYAFASDLPAFNAWYQATMPAVFDMAYDDLVNLAHIQMPWLQDQRIGPVLGALGAAPGNINVPFLDGRQVVLELDGEGRSYHPQNAESSHASWLADARGSIDIVEDAPARVASTIMLICDGGNVQPFIMQQELRLDRLTRVIQTRHSDVSLFQTEIRFVNYSDIPAGCTTTWDEFTGSTFAMQTFGRDQVLPIGAGANPGRWATRVPAPVAGSLAGVNAEYNAGIVDFTAGTVEAPGLAATMNMAPNADNGIDLVFQAPDLGNAPIHMQVFRTRDEGRGGEQWIGNADGLAGTGALGLGGLSVRETHADLFTDPDQALGAWRSAFAVVTEGRHSSFPAELIFEVSPGSPGLGIRRQILENGAQSQWPFSWEIDGSGRVVITTWYSTVTGQLSAVCPDACYVLQRRTWQPVSLVDDAQGKRLYVIEEILHGNEDSDLLDLLSRRVSFYDETVAPTRAPVLQPQPAPARTRLR